MKTAKNKILSLSVLLLSSFALMSFAHDCLYTFMFAVHHAEHVFEQNANNCPSGGVGVYFCHMENQYQYDQSIDNAVSDYDDCCDGPNAQGCP